MGVHIASDYRKNHPASVVRNIKQNADKIWCADKQIYLYWDATVTISKTDETMEQEKKTKSIEVKGSKARGSSQAQGSNDLANDPAPERPPQDVVVNVVCVYLSIHLSIQSKAGVCHLLPQRRLV